MSFRPVTDSGVGGRPLAIGAGLAILAAFGFSLKAVLVKLAYAFPSSAPVEPITLLALRMLFAFPVFFVVALRQSRGLRPLSRNDWLGVVGLGLLGYYGAVMFDFMGLRYISAALERLIAFTYPVFVVFLGAMIWKRRISRREWCAILFCYGGIAVTFAFDLSDGAGSENLWLGSALVLVSSVMYAIYLIGGGELIAKIGASRFTALAMMVSTFATLAHFLATQPLALLLQPAPIYGLSFALAMLSTVLPVFALAGAIRHIGAARAALIGCVGPLLTMGIGWWLLDEPLTPARLLGALLVIIGIGFIGRR